MTEIPTDRRQVGAEGERVAERYLVARGMEVVDRNWRCPTGEVDLVLRDGDELVVGEVKTRRSTRFGQPVEAITRAKLARLRRLAGCWLEAHEVPTRRVRLDVVALLRHPDGTYAVTHVRGAGA
ncbi:YraN family protein [Janibacter melonis]|uniref:YraN family protein n=1 Tax=Janibacter melonis TaxID=262209 RepID=UPI00174E3DB5|nr:YraN family protein [Janibacter melonis]